MSKLTFGVEMEMFIKHNVPLHKLIITEMKINGFTTFQELFIFIIKKTTYESNAFSDNIQTPFTKSIDNKSYDISVLKDYDHYRITLIIIYIICKNNINISFSLSNIDTGYDIIYFKDGKKINWHYDMDGSLFIDTYYAVKTYRTIFDNFPQLLTKKDFLFYTEFVSSIYNNTEEVKHGVGNLISSITDLKLNPLHSKHTSNHIHFSIKKEKDTDPGIKDPYLVFCITYVFYVLQNFIYLLCLPERRTSQYCTSLNLLLNTWDKSFDEFTLDEFFNVLITMKIPENDRECYLDHSEITRLTALLSEKNSIVLTSKQLIKKIESIDTKIKKLTTLPNYIEKKPFKDLVFEHQLIVLMHFYHQNTKYKMNNNLKKYNMFIDSIHEIRRYKILNLKKLSERQSCTLELRVKHGSNDSTEISNFCILIEKFVNIAEQMVVNKHIPLLKSLANILNIHEDELIIFKSIKSKDLHLYYTAQKPLLKKILKGLFKTDTVIIKYWQKQLKKINDPKNLTSANSLNSKSYTESSSNSHKRTL
jgi:coenzyme F420-reducing hydrogenase delta subunit